MCALSPLQSVELAGYLGERWREGGRREGGGLEREELEASVNTATAAFSDWGSPIFSGGTEFSTEPGSNADVTVSRGDQGARVERARVVASLGPALLSFLPRCL